MITAIIIAKDEEERIVDCLESVAFCDERIVVDGGSTDRTAEIAERMGAKVIVFPSNDFSDMRNAGLKKATEDWILYIDADERVSLELKDAVEYLTIGSGRGNKLNGYFVKRKNFYLGNHEWPYIEQLERLFKRKALKGWKGKLHESPIIEGLLGTLDGFLFHYTHRNITEMFAKTIAWSKIEAELRYNDGHPKMAWWRFPRVMLTAFLDSYIRQKGWKAGTVGLVESMYQAFSSFVTYARLWELQNKK